MNISDTRKPGGARYTNGTSDYVGFVILVGFEERIIFTYVLSALLSHGCPIKNFSSDNPAQH